MVILTLFLSTLRKNICNYLYLHVAISNLIWLYFRIQSYTHLSISFWLWKKIRSPKFYHHLYLGDEIMCVLNDYLIFVLFFLHTFFYLNIIFFSEKNVSPIVPLPLNFLSDRMWHYINIHINKERKTVSSSNP